MVLLDKFGKIQFSNAHAEKLFGFRNDETLGCSVDVILPFFSLRLESLNVSRLLQFNTDAVMKDHGTFMAQVMAGFVETAEEPQIFLSVSPNRSDSVNEMMKSSRERFKILFDHAPDAIYLITWTGHFIDGNKAAFEMTGFSREEIIGKSFLELHMIPLEDIPRAIRILTVASIKRKRSPERFSMKRKDGNTLELEIRTYPIELEGKKVILGIARDVSDRKRMEDEKNIMQELRLVMSEADDLQSALQSALDKVCEIKKWPFGEVWVQATGAEKMVRHISSRSSRSMAALDVLSSKIAFRPGEGLVGRVWRLRSTEWISNIEASGDLLLRKESALKAGLKSCCAVPVSGGGQIIAVLIFYMNEMKGEDPDIVDFVLTVADHIGFAFLKKQAEEEKFRLAAIVESSHDAIISTDTELVITSWNKGAEAMFGHTRQEALGSTLSVMIPSSITGEWQQRLNKIKKGTDVPPFETGGRRKDGASIDLFLTVSPIVDRRGNVIGYSKSARDITERNKMQEKICEQRELISNVLKYIPHSVYWKDRNLVYLGCNMNLALAAGLDDPSGVVGKKDLDMPWSAEEKKHFNHYDSRVLESGESMFNIEETIHEANGIERQILTSRVPLRDRLGRAIAVLGIFMDLTERKKLEEQLRQSQKMEAVGFLAGNLAHDFNNLLQIIQGYTQFLLRDEESGNQKHQDLTEIQKAAETGTAITRQLLTFSSRHVIKKEKMDIGALLLKREELMRRMLGAAYELKLSLEPGSKNWIEADEGQIEQVFMNIIMNARDAMPEGGKISITLKATIPENGDFLPAPDMKRKEYITVTIEDTGPGIRPEIREKIFNPFFTTKQKEEGTGLGLSICYQIIRNCAGSIWAGNREGGGAIFHIRLPKIAGEPMDTAVTETRAAVPTVTHNEVILYAEDEPALRNLASRLLRGQGYTVLPAANGVEAIKIAEEHGIQDIDIILTDMMMPLMNGKDMVDQLMKKNPGLKVILISAYADSEGVQRWLATNKFAFLQKPARLEDLLGKIREVLDESPTKSLTSRQERRIA